MKRLPTDGQVVSSQPVLVHPEYQDLVQIDRILYLVDGLQVVGFLAKPISATPQRFPVLLYNRGGYRKFSKINDQILHRIAGYAVRGYVVLATQYRGNDGGQGQDEYGGADVKDVFALAWLADSLPEADVSRMVMFGHSRGGMMTYLCIRHGLPLQAAAVTSAPTNLARRPLTHALEQLYGDLFGEPEQNPTPYFERSALCWPETLTTPLLIQAGGEDNRVVPEESLLLVKRLQELGYEHKFILYPHGEHHLQNVQEERDQEIFAWFARYLKKEV